MAIPPLPEQRRIVAKLESLQSRSRRAREALEAVPQLLEKLRHPRRRFPRRPHQRLARETPRRGTRQRIVEASPAAAKWIREASEAGQA